MGRPWKPCMAIREPIKKHPRSIASSTPQISLQMELDFGIRYTFLFSPMTRKHGRHGVWWSVGVSSLTFQDWKWYQCAPCNRSTVRCVLQFCTHLHNAWLSLQGIITLLWGECLFQSRSSESKIGFAGKRQRWHVNKTAVHCTLYRESCFASALHVYKCFWNEGSSAKLE